jgi:galactokinase
LVKGAINQLYKHSPEFRRKYTSQGVHIAVWSDVPRQSGLGGSSLYVLLTLTGLRQVYTLDPRTHNDYVLAELAQRAEALELGITCGFADRYVPLFGGLAYIDYRGKLHHQPQEEEPFATYERLDDYLPRDPLNNCPSLPLVVACTGLRHDSGDVHSQMRPRYLEEHATWNERGGEPPTMVKLMRAAWQTAWKGKIALLKGDLETFGELMNENHLLVDRMMNYCGFPDGAGWANNLFIQEARKHGALGAKLTGAGNGGSVFALVRQGEEQSLAEVWHKAALRAGLDQAWVYLPRVSMHGLECHEE